MLFCCHRYFGETEKRYLDDTIAKTHQVLEFGECPICKTKRIWYKYTNVLAKKTREITLKGKKADSLLKELLSQPYYELKDLKTKNGTKNNMFWRYSHQGTKKDFNNTIYEKLNSQLFIYTDTRDIYSTPAEGVFSYGN